MKRFFSVLLAVLTLAFIVLSPPYIVRGLNSKTAVTPASDYSGVIDVWHIIGFKPYTGSTTTWLVDCTNAIEKSNFGVYFNVSAMSVEEYAERRQQGYKADVYSFPMGLMYSDDLADMSNSYILPMLSGNLELCTDDENGLFAVPYYYSGYAFMSNSVILGERSVALPDEISGNWLNSVSKTLNFTKGKREYSFLSGDPVASALLGVKNEIAPLDSFTSGGCAMAIADIRAVGDASRRLSNNKGFSYETRPCTSYTDLVQFLAFDDEIKEPKLNYALELLDAVMSEKRQQKLVNLGCFPALRNISLSELPSELASFADTLSKPLAPRFLLYKRQKDALNSAALRILSGDEGGLAELRSRISELFPYSPELLQNLL